MDERKGVDRPVAPKREPYTAPKLSVYGSLADLTAAVGMNGNLDGGGGSAKRSMP